MNWNDFYKSVKAGQYQSVYLFTGPEEHNKREALEALRRALLPAGLEQLNEAVLDGADDAQLREGISAVTRRDPMAVCFLAAPAGEQYAAALGTGAQSAVHAGNALRAVLSVLGGKGGGRPDSAFGRCARMDEEEARAALRSMMA